MITLSKQQARDFLVQTHLLDGPKQKPGRGSIAKILKRFKIIQVDSIDNGSWCLKACNYSRHDGIG